jgi:diaminohydroxyphosphoribosylaminopyrimidine deaminase/5-amino-6-(5-phosphoribosylamino)uracil reductase
MGAGHVSPNPMVGAVLVYNDKIIGEGYHKEYGYAHAEVNCINSVAATDRQWIDKSTLYVSLEPCAHFGKTPPCADLIIKNNIPAVVIGCTDNYTEVNGKGIEKLLSAGVTVTVGVLQQEAEELNKRFFIFHTHQRPYIILKWAQSNNKKIASGDNNRTFISNHITNRLVHQWRAEEAAIMVGTNTARKDDPALTARLYPGKNPVRIVIDIDLKLSADLQLFDGSVKTIVFNAIKEEAGQQLQFLRINANEKIIPQILTALYHLKIQSIIIEGGTTLLQSFIDEKLWDEARVITNTTMEIAEGIAAPVLHGQQLVNTQHFLTDSIDYFTNNGA